jgi:hypothetical protein
MKRALLIGIDDYRNLPPLRGCVNDVNALLSLLESNEDGCPNLLCHALTASGSLSFGASKKKVRLACTVHGSTTL